MFETDYSRSKLLYIILANIKEALYIQLIRECSRTKFTQTSTEIAFA